MALADYEPVTGSEAESEQIRQLRDEVDQLHATSMSVLAETAGHNPAAVPRNPESPHRAAPRGGAGYLRGDPGEQPSRVHRSNSVTPPRSIASRSC